MGGSESKTTQLNKAITNVTTEVVAKSSSAASGSIIATQDLVFAGTGENIDILQNAKISLDVLQKSDVNAAMQADILTKIMAEINKEKSGLPEITKSKSNSEITNIVENNISSSFSQESLAELSLSIELDQSIAFLKGSAYENVKVAQTAEGVGKLINDMSGAIISEMTAGTDLESKTTEVTKNPIADVVTSVTDGIANIAGTIGDIFGFSSQMVALFFAVVIVGYFLASKQIDKQPSAPGAGRPPPGRRPAAPVGYGQRAQPPRR